MKKTMYLFAASGLLAFTACTKIKQQPMTIVKDCTGTYLRFENKDYKVCNTGATENYADGSKVTASFKKVNNCDGEEDRIICQLYHANEGWIVVENIK